MRRTRWSFALLACSWLAAGPVAAAADGDGPRPGVQEFADKGIRVEFSVAPAAAEHVPGSPLVEGHSADVRFRITDEASGAPISPLQPAAWVNLLSGDAGAERLACEDKIKLYLQGTLSFRPEVDLNKFYILVLNNDASISVIDPILGVSNITQLYAMVLLEAPGEDWAMGPDQQELFVSMPRAGKVAVVDVANFKVRRNLDAGQRPSRVVLQPDARYLWVGNDAPATASGVTAIDRHSGKVAAFIPTGSGHHEVAFSADSLTAFVTNGADGTVSVIDTARMEKVADLPVGGNPVAVAYSPLSGAAYVASGATGTITAIDASTRTVRGTIATGPGLSAFAFAPGGRWGFALNTEASRLQVFDAADHRVIHDQPVGQRPDRVAFTDDFAYIRSLDASKATLIQLANLGKDPVVPTQLVPYGTRLPGGYDRPALASPLAATGEWGVMLMAHPLDRTVSYYMEGMTAPMGTFQTYGRTPRAVTVVDRSLAELDKGTYSAKFRIPAPGTYEVAFLLDAPVIYHCFEFTAGSNPALERARNDTPYTISLLSEARGITAGKPFTFRFSLVDRCGGDPAEGLGPVEVVAIRSPWDWRQRATATPAEDGSYQVEITPDRAETYYLYFAVPSRKIEFNQLPRLAFRALPAPGAGAESTR